MRHHPLTDPGRPTISSPARFLLWLARHQLSTIAAAMFFGTLWMLAQALAPFLLGRAIDEGVTAKNTEALIWWSACLLGLGLAGAIAGVFRHRAAVSNWLTAAYRVQQLVTRKAVELGGSLSSRVATGEVVSIGASDLEHFGGAMDILGRLTGAVVSIGVVAVILLGTSVPLGLVVLIGVPVMLLLLAPVLKPLHARQSKQREQVGELATVASDIVTGLRALRGIGGEEVFGGRYRRDSARVRDTGIRVAKVHSLLEASNVAVPGIFVLLVVWLGARFAVRGDLTAGELVAFYGYAAFLVTPLRTLTEAAQKITRGLVAARRTTRVLQLAPQIAEPQAVAATPPSMSDLYDSASGITIKAGRLTAVVSNQPAETAALADRLGRHADPTDGEVVTYGGVSLRDLPVDLVRRRILVNDTDARLFSGVLREQLDPSGRVDHGTLLAAVDTASASDVLETVPDGFETQVEERGRSFSGGQRQRLVLVRALAADPEVLVLVEPTSAVDAHTEARIAERLRGARVGRTTVVVTASPLVLDRADEVVLLMDGRVAARGRHRDLLSTDPTYRAVVTREEVLT